MSKKGRKEKRTTREVVHLPPERTDEEKQLAAARAERVFVEVRRAVIGRMRHNIVLETREPEAAVFKHLYLVTEEIREGLRARGHNVPDTFDPLVMAAMAEQHRQDSTLPV